MMPRVWLGPAALSVSVFLAMACGGKEAQDSAPVQPSAQATSSSPTSSPPSSSVPAMGSVSPGKSPPGPPPDIVADATALVFTAQGGLPWGTYDPDAGGCFTTDDTFTIDVASRKLTWSRCVPTRPDGGSGGLVGVFVTGSMTVASPDYESITTALRAMTPTTRTDCGYDAPSRTITIQQRGEVSIYRDDFYACNHESGTYVAGAESVFDLLYKLTQ